MKVGDLVWHVDDLKEGITVPGLVIDMSMTEATVFFGDRTFNEYHTIDDLTQHPVLYEDDNIMGNP
tara:strand:+ start:398 stop:595 length:198 start_codon:yes stop_codon:yes gene_type:complete